MSEVMDCLIIGGGPAGLTAAIYLGRFRRRVVVVDGGGSRAAWIDKSHNLPGFPGGMNGPALLDRMREQARLYGAALREGHVDALLRAGSGLFTVAERPTGAARPSTPARLFWRPAWSRTGRRCPTWRRR